MSISLFEQVLQADVKPAFGCTEPVTIALAACHAARQAGLPLTEVWLRLSTNLFKNAMEVGIPGTGGAHGIALAAALGCVSRSPQLDLSLLSSIPPEMRQQALDLVASGIIKITIDQTRSGLHITAEARGPDGHGRAVISGSHENLTLLEKNGQPVLTRQTPTGEPGTSVLELRRSLAEIPVDEILGYLPRLGAETRAFLWSGVEMNRNVAEAGMGVDGQLRIGSAYHQLIEEGWLGDDVLNRAKALTSAAVDARMSGCNLPVMTSAGSGNQGLTITLPLAVLAEKVGASPERLHEALALSHGITSILKHHTGTLSAMCGCVVCSGTGLTAGAVWLMGGDAKVIAAGVNNMVGSITGIICDGAKVGCSIKLVCAVDAAFQAALMAMRGVQLPPTNGILGSTLEESLRNIGRIAAPGMTGTDDQILAIMIGKPN